MKLHGRPCLKRTIEENQNGGTGCCQGHDHKWQCWPHPESWREAEPDLSVAGNPAGTEGWKEFWQGADGPGGALWLLDLHRGGPGGAAGCCGVEYRPGGAGI